MHSRPRPRSLARQAALAALLLAPGAGCSRERGAAGSDTAVTVLPAPRDTMDDTLGSTRSSPDDTLPPPGEARTEAARDSTLRAAGKRMGR